MYIRTKMELEHIDESKITSVTIRKIKDELTEPYDPIFNVHITAHDEEIPGHQYYHKEISITFIDFADATAALDSITSIVSNRGSKVIDISGKGRIGLRFESLDDDC